VILELTELASAFIGPTSGRKVLQIEDRSEAAKKIRKLMFGKYTKEQLEAASLASI